MRKGISRCRTWACAGISAAMALSLRANDARADGPSAAPETTRSEVHLQIGGAALQPAQPAHPVRVTSNADGTRILAIDTTGLTGAADTMGPPHQEVCVAPCTTPMSPSTTYMVRGWGIPDSPHFGINDETTEVHVRVGDPVLEVLGATSIALGVIGLVGGAAVLPVGLAQPETSSDRHTFIKVGEAGLGGGAALIVLGAVLGVLSTTHIYDGHGARLAGVHLTPGGLTF